MGISEAAEAGAEPSGGAAERWMGAVGGRRGGGGGRDGHQRRVIADGASEEGDEDGEGPKRRGWDWLVHHAEGGSEIRAWGERDGGFHGDGVEYKPGRGVFASHPPSPLSS